MEYELAGVQRLFRNAASYTKSLRGDEVKEGEDFVDRPIFRAVNTKRRVLREEMQKRGLTGGRQKVRLRKQLQRRSDG